MKDNVKKRYASCMRIGSTPADLPVEISQMYDRLAVRYQYFQSQQEPPYTLDPLIAFVIENVLGLEKQIAQLTGNAKRQTASVDQEAIDMRTREGRALKEQLQAAGV